jgi:uncharacterized damage-inducible protein DinB
MFDPALALLRDTRTRTLDAVADLTQQQSDFRPAPDRWSVGEVLDHLLIAERMYRDVIGQLIELEKAGRRPVITHSFSDVNTSIAYIPKAFLPFLEVPFTMLNLFVPSFVREAMAEFRLIPAQRPTVAEPVRGKPVGELRDALRQSFEQTATLLRANPRLDYARMRYRHPLLGDNNVMQVLRIVTMHERRHQSQIREILRAREFPKAA